IQDALAARRARAPSPTSSFMLPLLRSIFRRDDSLFLSALSHCRTEARRWFCELGQERTYWGQAASPIAPVIRRTRHSIRRSAPGRGCRDRQVPRAVSPLGGAAAKVLPEPARERRRAAESHLLGNLGQRALARQKTRGDVLADVGQYRRERFAVRGEVTMNGTPVDAETACHLLRVAVAARQQQADELAHLFVDRRAAVNDHRIEVTVRVLREHD